jgi:hypothetical protein
MLPEFLRLARYAVALTLCRNAPRRRRRESGEAEDVARSVPGVRKVYNHVYSNNA